MSTTPVVLLGKTGSVSEGAVKDESELCAPLDRKDHWRAVESCFESAPERVAPRAGPSAGMFAPYTATHRMLSTCKLR